LKGRNPNRTNPPKSTPKEKTRGKTGGSTKWGKWGRVQKSQR